MLVRWTNWNDIDRGTHVLDQVRRELDAVFDRARPGAGWLPQERVEDTEEGLTLQVALPGVREEDLHIEVERGVVRIKAEGGVRVPEGYQLARQELSDLHYERSFTVPDHYTLDETTATLEHGLLTLHIPRSEAARPRRIQIQTAS